MDQLLACISQLDVINEMQREVMGGGDFQKPSLREIFSKGEHTLCPSPLLPMLCLGQSGWPGILSHLELRGDLVDGGNELRVLEQRDKRSLGVR